jgi:hypothetical protein
MQNFGISLTQIIVSVLLLSFGILTYYSIPWAFINGQTGLFSFYINLLLLFLILGMIFTSQALVPTLENFFLDMMIFFRPRDLKMKPIIKKNLESHAGRNQKTSLMFTVTLAFLVFAGANFKQIQFFLETIARSWSGSDILVTKLAVTNFNLLALDEFKIKGFLIENNVERGGIITDFSFHSQSIAEILILDGEDPM